MATDQNEQGGGATSSRMGPMPGFSARSRKASCGGSSTRSATSKPNRSATSSWLDRHAGRLPPQRRLRGCRPRYPPPSGTGRRQRPAVRRAGPEPARAMARPACGTVPFTTMPPRLPTSMPPPSGTGRRQRPAVRRAGPEPARAMARPACGTVPFTTMPPRLPTSMPPPSGTGRRQRPAVRRAGPEPARAMARPACGTVPFTTMPPRLPTSMPPPSGAGRRQRPAVRRAGPEPARAMARPARAGWLPSPRCLRGCRPRCSPTVRRRPAAAAGRPAGRARA